VTRRFVAVAGLALVVGGASVFSAFTTRTEAWSDPNTWNGHPPIAGSVAYVPAGHTVVLDVDPPELSRLVIDGRLVIPDRDARLRAGAIVVRGKLDAGTAIAPIRHRVTIDLDARAPGRGILDVVGGGRVELVGETRTAWLRLARTASAGDVAVTFEHDPGWRAGAVIAIAPSGFDAHEAEERTIVAADGPRVTLDRPLAYHHWGATASGVDERAESGLLTHTIAIESPTSDDGNGGQVRILRGGTLRASDVAFERLGRRGELGAYPIHFHLVGDARTSFVENSSIAHSNNRCIAVHGSSGVTIRGNVAFDTIGHCYFLEDGIETANVFEDNLGMLTRAAEPGHAILISDAKPATYWLTNPANRVAGNVAAGSDGMGFWYALSPHPTGPSTDATIWPRRTALAAFDRNVAHANAYNGLFVDIERNPPGVIEAPNYAPPVVADFTHFTSYKNRRRGAWLRGTHLRLTNAAIADNAIGVTFAGDDAVLRDSLVVGESDNHTGPPKPFEPDFPIRGFEFYDGRVGVERTHFSGFRSNALRAAGALGTLQYSPFFTDPTNYASELTFTDADRVYFGRHAGATDRLGADGYRGTGFRDVDGSVSGVADAAVVLDTPLFADADCRRETTWNARVCRASYASVFITGIDAGANRPGPVRVASTVRPTYLTLYGNAETSRDARYQANVRAGNAYVVSFARAFPKRLEIGIHHLREGELTLILPQAPPDATVRDERPTATSVRYERPPPASCCTSPTEYRPKHRLRSLPCVRNTIVFPDCRRARELPLHRGERSLARHSSISECLVYLTFNRETRNIRPC